MVIYEDCYVLNYYLVWFLIHIIGPILSLQLTRFIATPGQHLPAAPVFA